MFASAPLTQADKKYGSFFFFPEDVYLGQEGREHDLSLSFKEKFWVESVILDSIREHFSVAIRSLLQAIRLINVP